MVPDRHPVRVKSTVTGRRWLKQSRSTSSIPEAAAPFGFCLSCSPNAFVALANTFIIINVGGGPTDDKSAVTLETPPDPDRVSSFLNIRVKDIAAVYAQ